MPDTIKTGTILIRWDILAGRAAIRRMSLCDWLRLVQNLDGTDWGRKVHEAAWTFSNLAGEIKATICGFDVQKTVHRAVSES